MKTKLLIFLSIYLGRKKLSNMQLGAIFVLAIHIFENPLKTISEGFHYCS